MHARLNMTLAMARLVDGHDRIQPEIDANMNFLREAIELANLGRLRRACYSLSERPRKAA